MKNHWLNKFRIGRQVRYKGVDRELAGKIGEIVGISPPTHSWTTTEWVDVLFEFHQYKHTKVISVEKDNLEIV
jgi:hypothetical protein